MNEMDEAVKDLSDTANELREIKEGVLREFAGIGQEWYATFIEHIIRMYALPSIGPQSGPGVAGAR